MVGDVKRPRLGHSFKDQSPGNGRVQLPRPREEWIEAAVPALISTEVWEQAQQQLALNHQRATRNNTKHAYLLQSLVVCGKCGRRMIGCWTASGTGRYYCPYRYPRGGAQACEGRQVSATRLSQEVWNYIQTLLADSQLLRQHYQQAQTNSSLEQASEAEQEINRLERKMQGQAREIQRLLDAYIAEVIMLEELKERRQRVEEQRGVLSERVVQLKRQQEQQQEEKRLLAGLDEFCQSIKEALNEPPFELKQRMVRLVVDTIVVESDKIVIKHIVPTTPIRLQTEHHVRATSL